MRDLNRMNQYQVRVLRFISQESASLIDLVYVLSGRTTVLGADADKLDRPFDALDDIERMREGIRIAT